MSDVFPVLIKGDPDAVAQLSAHFRQICDVMSSARDKIHAIRSDSTTSQWFGMSADAFRDKLGDLPGQLDKAVASYDEMAWCTWRYENTLRSLQSQLIPVESRWEQATRDLASIQSQQAASANPTDPSWDQKMQPAKDEIASALQEANRLGAGFQEAVSQCTQAIDEASSKGIPPDSMWSHFTGALGDVAGVVVNVVEDVGGVLVKLGKECLDLPGALVNFVEHPSWESFNRVVEDATAVLTIAALVLGVGALAGVAEGFVASAQGFVQIAMVVDNSAKVGVDIEQRKMWPDFALDMVSLSTSALSSYAKLAMTEGQPGEAGILERVAAEPTPVEKWSTQPWLTDGTNFVSSKAPGASTWLDSAGQAVPMPSIATQVAAGVRYVNVYEINHLADATDSAVRYGKVAVAGVAASLPGDTPRDERVKGVTDEATHAVLEMVGDARHK